MANIRKNTGSKVPAKSGDRYLFGFTVTGSSGTNYRISFDTAKGCWMCSCRGCIGHQKTCKHLRACGLTGPEKRNQPLPTPATADKAKRLALPGRF